MAFLTKPVCLSFPPPSAHTAAHTHTRMRTHACTHTHMHAHSHSHSIHMHTHTRTNAHMHTHAHSHPHTHPNMHTHTRTQYAQACTQPLTCIHTCTCTHIHTHAHACTQPPTRTRMHTHAHTLIDCPSLGLLSSVNHLDRALQVEPLGFHSKLWDSLLVGSGPQRNMITEPLRDSALALRVAR